MFHLIQSLVPRALHRAALRIAHTVRHRWRRWRKVQLEGVSIIACNAAGNILLVRHAYGPDVWTLLGGGLKRGEDAVAAAVRETHEEVSAVLHDARLIGRVAESLSGSPHTAHVVTGWLQDVTEPDRREIAQARFFARDALPTRLSGLVAARLALLE